MFSAHSLDLLVNDAEEDFALRCGGPPRGTAAAPGRVNLIGEHTDYNDGFVLPLAIDRAICMCLQPRTGRVVTAHSLDFGETGEFSLEGLTRGRGGWAEYLKGVAWCLQEERL